jgi:hypothetical protein
VADYIKSTNFAVKDTLATGNPAKIVKGTEIDTEFNAIASAVASKLDANSPTLTGTPLAPTASTATNNTQIATTAYVVNRIANDTVSALALKANLASPTFTGVPAAPTPVLGTNTTQIATTAFVAEGLALKANLLSPTFTGTPTAPTAVSGNNTTQLATTAFVQAALQAIYPIGSIYINATNSTNPGTLLGFGTWTAFGAGRVPVGFNAGDPLFDTAEETGGSKDAIVVSHTHTATSTVTDPGHRHTIPIHNAGGVPENGNNNNGGTDSTVLATELSGTNTTGITVATTIASTGSSGTNANLQPYITVYMFKRTA